jgi:hypothetical protein
MLFHLLHNNEHSLAFLQHPPPNPLSRNDRDDSDDEADGPSRADELDGIGIDDDDDVSVRGLDDDGVEVEADV